LNVDADLCELEDGEGGGAVLGEHEAQQGVDLGVEAAVTQTQQETAQDCYILAAIHTTSQLYYGNCSRETRFQTGIISRCIH